VRNRTRCVADWQVGLTVRRWLALAFLGTERNFREIMGDRKLWTLEAILSESQSAAQQVVAR
jgi:hypothetical protein